MTYVETEMDLVAYMEGDWYADAEGLLYVIPLEIGSIKREPYGSDNATMAKLLTLEKGSYAHRNFLDAFSIYPVRKEARGWNPKSGFYSD